ncbi:protection of telomeres protein 1b [Phtheirospermum japonicum]|uniref:Protection of telomeres protein 1b n=1 Tax=Phtheirospermum japonicum TaxID=374723 RepID=A0A830BMM0_9LAMI|nr:protection of telomeres protein 1b [Phtheirospermum japonicum]
MSLDDYKFMQIVDAINCINLRVNLIGVVVESSLPKKSKGTARIIDESRASYGIFINFFSETMEKLPYVESVGDIVIVSHVVMKIRGKDDVYALFNKKFSSFALFKGRDCSNNETGPYQTSPNYKPRDQDNKFITALRKWSTQHKIAGLNESLSLREMKEGERINLLCKILHVCEVKEDQWMVFVWDGTDTPPASVDTKLEDEMENPLPLQLETSLLSRDILCTFPSVGTVLRMIVDQGNEKLGIKYLKTNRWVKFGQVICEVRAALRCAVLMPFSKLCYLPDDDGTVIERLRSYNERVSSKWGRMPFTSFPWPSHITETDHPDVPFVTLMNVLTHPEVTYKFRCVVRVVAIFPWRADDFRSPSGVYRVRLTLEDPTARIHAFLYAEDGMKFFGDSDSVDLLTRKRNMLLGVSDKDKATTLNNVSRNPPWIQCCLKSYYIDKSDIWGSRNYRIFDTTLLADHTHSEQLWVAQSGSMSIEIKLSRFNRIYRPDELLEGKVITKLTSAISYQSIRLTVNGAVNLQVRGGSAGVIESLYGVIKPIPIVKKVIDIRSSGKIASGMTEIIGCWKLATHDIDAFCVRMCSFGDIELLIPFSVMLKDPKEENLEKFYETFHGSNISIQYLVTVDVVRGYLQKHLSTTVEIIVESEKGGFRMTGKICTQCSLSDPISGELTVESSTLPIQSIDIYLLQVESILIGEKIATESSVADGDICRCITLPIYIILPRLLTCPTIFAGPFSVEFKLSIVITFLSDLSKKNAKADPQAPKPWMAMESVPLELVRTM